MDQIQMEGECFGADDEDVNEEVATATHNPKQVVPLSINLGRR